MEKNIPRMPKALRNFFVFIDKNRLKPKSINTKSLVYIKLVWKLGDVKAKRVEDRRKKIINIIERVFFQPLLFNIQYIQLIRKKTQRIESVIIENLSFNSLPNDISDVMFVDINTEKYRGIIKKNVRLLKIFIFLNIINEDIIVDIIKIIIPVDVFSIEKKYTDERERIMEIMRSKQ